MEADTSGIISRISSLDITKKGYDYYTVTLNADGQKGKLNYSEVICGDCLAPLAECAHSYILRQEKK
jgi:hypothetical protein